MAIGLKRAAAAHIERPQHLPDDRATLLLLAEQFGREAQRNNPYLRFLAVSGSLIRPQGETHEDIDFFAVTSAGHIWEAFLLCLWQGRRFAGRRGLPRTFLCFNYLVDERHPQEIDLTRAEHVRSFLNLKVLLGQEMYYDLLLRLRKELEAQEPVLYRETLKRVQAELPAGGGRSPAPAGRSRRQALSVAMARWPFILMVKRAEAKRRSYFPGGLIYSNSRVIRSHLRVAWENTARVIACNSTGEAFSEVAPSYQEQVVASPANRHMRSMVHDALGGLVTPGSRVLDLGAGTGEDAIWLARRGAEVLAIDIAPGMVRETLRRVAGSGLENKIQARCLAIENLRELLPREAGAFDLVLADFGALNLSGPPETWAPVLSRLLKPDGKLVANMMNRWCLWEIFAGLIRGRIHYGLRRLENQPIRVGDHYLAVTFFTPGAFAKKLRTHFLRSGICGLCVTALPPDLDGFADRVPRIARFLERLDKHAGRWWFWRGLGDHYLITFKKQDGPAVEFHTRGGITAAPVVADVNNDNIPEIILAADKLYVIGPSGRPLPGWPRRTGGAIASTATCVSRNGHASIHVGSDNDYLNTFHLHGTSVDFQRFKTGGDVFSSPWAGDLPGDGRQAIVFGSDDGKIYALTESGEILPGWPFTTGAYVSASPVAVQTGKGTGIVLGSWDGSLYLLDHHGQVLPGWPQRLGFPIWSTCAVADIDGCGHAEIIAAAQKLFVFHGDGSALRGFPVQLNGYAVASPVAGDINGDGQDEIVICSDRIYAFDRNGHNLPGFPFVTGAYIWASPILFDIDGDGLPEIVVGDFRGRLWAVDGNGKLSTGYPKTLGNGIAAPATAADIDGDGYLELLAATREGRFVILRTDCPDNRAAAPWPQFRGRTGNLPFISATNGVMNFPGGAVSSRTTALLEDDTSVAGIEIYPPSPRPFETIEVRVTLNEGVSLDGGLLEYELDGKLHPSPLLKNNGYYFGLIQPLHPFKPVNFVLKLSLGDNRCIRYPAEDVLQIRVGIKGFKHAPGTASTKLSSERMF